MKAQRLLLLFLIGAIGGSLLDAFHVYSNIERYPMPAFMGLAWWVPLLFGAAGVAIGYSHPMVDPLLHNRHPHKSIVSSAAESGWIVLAYLISASTLDSLVKAGFLCIIYLNFWLLVGTGWQNLLLSLVTAITGILVEMVLVAGGAFHIFTPILLAFPIGFPVSMLVHRSLWETWEDRYSHQQREDNHETAQSHSNLESGDTTCSWRQTQSSQ